MKKTTIYFDMDGVLAGWRNVSIEETYKKGFFLSAPVNTTLIVVIRMLIDSGYNVKILSSAYNHRCRVEKRTWLDMMGLQKVKATFVPYGARKFDYVRDRAAILVDDFSNNLHEWQSYSPTYVGVKFYNGINGSKGTWSGNYITWVMPPIKIYEKLAELAARLNTLVDSKLVYKPY